MKDKKELTQGNNEASLKNNEAELLDNMANKTDRLSKDINKGHKTSNEDLNKELEELAATFKSELNKNKTETELMGEIFDDDGLIPEDELCACCGERRRDTSFGENYEYCAECREAMKKYPFSFQNILIALVVIFISVFSVINFSVSFDGYYHVYKAKEYERKNLITSSVSEYNEGIEFFESGEVVPHKLYIDSAYLVYDTMLMGTNSMEDVIVRVEKGLLPFQTKMPLYIKEVDLRKQCYVLKGTMQKFYEVVQNPKYKDFKPENKEMYEKIMNEIGSIIDKPISVPSFDGKNIEQAKSEAAMVRFCQYMFAYTNKKYDDAYKYMLEVEKLRPEYTWLYAYELAFTEVQNGNIEKAHELTKRLLNRNEESVDGYVVSAYVLRMTGKYDEAVEATDKGLKYNPENPELNRSKAMALCLKGDFKEAKKFADKVYKNNKYGMLCFTRIVIENELGNKDTVNSLKNEAKLQGVNLPERLRSYLDGKLTVKQLFAEGTGDAE